MREAEVAEWKTREVEETRKFIESQPVVGIISLANLPSSQFQQIKKQLRGNASVKVTRSGFIIRALEKVENEKLKELKNYVEGPSAVIISKENPFKLFRIIKHNRSKAAAKPGMIAEKDLIIPAGETSIPVGPALSELKMAKVDCKIDKGKIVVSKDSVVTKKGEIVSAQAASALSKLDIKPVEIGLSLNAIYENGIIYKSDVLNIDEEEFMNNLQSSYLRALNLSVNAGYPTKQGITFMVQNVFTKARNLAVNAKIYNKHSIELILTKSAAEMKGLKSAAAEKGYNG